MLFILRGEPLGLDDQIFFIFIKIKILIFYFFFALINTITLRKYTKVLDQNSKYFCSFFTA